MKLSEIDQKVKEQLNREWIITNGIGGFASQSAIGANTRKYHGLLVAPLTPPARRFMILSQIDESIEIDGKQYDLFSNICKDDYISEGFMNLVDFKKEYIPIFTYKVENVFIKKFICMKYGENTVTVLYRIKNQNSETKLKLTPLLNFRDFHTVNQNPKINIKQSHVNTKVKVVIEDNNLTPIYMNCSEGKYLRYSDCIFNNMFYTIEQRRGFDATENHAIPGVYNINIDPNEEKDITFVCSLQENIDEIDAVDVINNEIMRISELTYDARLTDKNYSEEKNQMIKELVIAADNFIVKRHSTGLHTVIAGYPWFLDWGRDTLISFEGLLLLTKRYDIAKEVLLTMIKDVKFGLVPNGYSGYDNRPLYNSADSSLLLFEQVHKLLEYTNDYDFVKEKMYPVLEKIIEAYSNKIDVDNDNIYLDSDYLLSAGSEDTQITWMDVKIGNKAVTPRNGKTVELNALWYNALKIMESLSFKFGDKDKSNYYEDLAEKNRQAFLSNFYNEDKKCLYDVLGDDKIRPNQLFAISLSNPVIDPNSDIAKHIIKVVYYKLLNDYGLKTLAAEEDGYVEKYEGDGPTRDSRYHQGITWPWLLGLYYDSLKNIIKVSPNNEEYTNMLNELVENTTNTFYKEMTQNATIGSISEIYDSVEPYKARGTFAQAWSVSEILRIITRK